MEDLFLIPHVLTEKGYYQNFGERFLSYGLHPPFLYPLKRRLPKRELLLHMENFVPLSTAPVKLLNFLFFRERKPKNCGALLRQLENSELLLPSAPPFEPTELWKEDGVTLIRYGESARYYEKVVRFAPYDGASEITENVEVRMTGEVASSKPYFVLHSTGSVPLPFGDHYIEIVVDPPLYHAKFFMPKGEPTQLAVRKVVEILTKLGLSPSQPKEVQEWNTCKKGIWPSENSLFCF